jgi:hypothetical protein
MRETTQASLNIGIVERVRLLRAMIESDHNLFNCMARHPINDVFACNKAGFA